MLLDPKQEIYKLASRFRFEILKIICDLDFGNWNFVRAST